MLAAAYFVAARLSLALAIPPGYATAVWPPSGIALAAMLLLGSRIWPGIWLGAALANVTVESSFVSATLIGSGNTVEALAGAALIRRYVGDPGQFRQAEDVLKFIVLCAVSAAIAATVALLPLASGHSLSWGEVLRNWWTWWQGDLAGMIILTPLILSWGVSDAMAWPRPKKAEAACFALLLVITAVAISRDKSSHFVPFSLTFVTLPFIFWAAFRFGQREVTTAVAAACAVAVGYAVERPDLFASVPLNEMLLMLLTFISMVVATGLVLVAVLGEGSRATDELRRSRDELESLAGRYAHYDSLTGLPNSVLFRERLAQLLALARDRNRKAAVAVLGIDRFKTINDTSGRQAGDALVKQIADRLSRDTSGSDIVARISGVQFAIAAQGFADAEAAATAASERLARGFGVPYSLGSSDLRLSARMGIALFPDHGDEPDTLFMHAESALQKAKSTGERCLLYTPDMSARVAEKLSLENRLQQAIERQEFVLHYQPKVSLDTRQLVGLEALIRWRSPELGLVPPMDFIPLLEETGLIREVGCWALRRAMLDQRLWAAEGLRVPRVAVNVSSIELRDRNFVAFLEELIGPAAGPALIDLEITESRVMEDIDATIDKLKRIGALGIGIAIDDFGTGYSSLAYLAKLPVQTIKIDGSFIARMLDDEDSMAVVQTIISLAGSLKLTTVAEGVESEEQADMLALLRCDQMQGYFIARPLPKEEIAALLRIP